MNVIIITQSLPTSAQSVRWGKSMMLGVWKRLGIQETGNEQTIGTDPLQLKGLNSRWELQSLNGGCQTKLTHMPQYKGRY